MILAIDPGNEQSAYVIYDDSPNPRATRVLEFQKIRNGELLSRIRGAATSSTRWQHITHVAIEMIASYGMPVGREVFETCVMIGRFIEAWPIEHTLVYRRDVKLHLCGQARAKDPNVRASLIDRFGGKAETKKGGVLYGITADIWSALAVAITYADNATKARAA